LAYFLINEFLSPPAIVLNDLRILDFSAFKMHCRIRLAAPPKGKNTPPKQIAFADDLPSALFRETIAPLL